MATPLKWTLRQDGTYTATGTEATFALIPRLVDDLPLWLIYRDHVLLGSKGDLAGAKAYAEGRHRSGSELHIGTVGSDLRRG